MLDFLATIAMVWLGLVFLVPSLVRRPRQHVRRTQTRRVRQ